MIPLSEGAVFVLFVFFFVLPLLAAIVLVRFLHSKGFVVNLCCSVIIGLIPAFLLLGNPSVNWQSLGAVILLVVNPTITSLAGAITYRLISKSKKK